MLSPWKNILMVPRKSRLMKKLQWKPQEELKTKLYKVPKNKEPLFLLEKVNKSSLRRRIIFMKMLRAKSTKPRRLTTSSSTTWISNFRKQFLVSMVRILKRHHCQPWSKWWTTNSNKIRAHSVIFWRNRMLPADTKNSLVLQAVQLRKKPPSKNICFLVLKRQILLMNHSLRPSTRLLIHSVLPLKWWPTPWSTRTRKMKF